VLHHRGREHFVTQLLRDEHVVSVSHDDPAHAAVDWRWNPRVARASGALS
jgi:hypothetical protein